MASKATPKPSFKSHPLTTAEKAWLLEVANSPLFDVRIAKVKLLNCLPGDFDPKTIDNRFYLDKQLTLLGLWHVDPDNEIFTAIRIVIEHVRNRIIAMPGIAQFTSDDVSRRADLPKDLVERTFYAISQLGRFSNGATLSGNGKSYSSITLSDDDSYDEYLRFTSVDDLLERYYLARAPEEKSSGNVANLWTYHLDSDFLIPKGAAKATKANTAFVLMAMDPAKPELEDVYNTIKAVCKEFGIAAYRADEIQHQDRITDLILEEIRACEHLIADLTYERPNVYYEVGYAHAINKRPILYRRLGTPLHFDLSIHNVPQYKNTTELRDLLIKRLEAILGRSGRSG